MRTTQQLSITLPKVMADMVKAKVRCGQYASESEVIRDGLRTLMARDRAVESWLHSQVETAYDALKADPARAVTADQLRANINPDGALPLLPPKVELAFEVLINPDDLSDDEQELYFEKLGESYRAPSPKEDKYFAVLRARGGLVGMDEEGNIIFSKASKSNAP